jgi:hypothetical protein
MYSLEVARKFWNNVRFWGATEDDCWLWIRGATGGYAQLLWKEFSTTKYAHRMAYELTYGEIPDGYVIDHECHNRSIDCPSGKQCLHRRCCNPRHLVAKTIGQNVKAAHQGRKERKTHCPHGHEWTPENSLILANGWRQCRKCAAARSSRWYYDNKACPVSSRHN